MRFNAHFAIPAAVAVIGSLLANADSFVLSGQHLRIGVGSDGYLINDNDGYILGLQYDPRGTGTFSAVGPFGEQDLLNTGSSWEYFALRIDGIPYGRTAANYGSMFNFTTTDTSAGNVLSAQSVGTIGGLDYTAVLWFARDASVVDFTVTLVNTTAAAVNEIYFARGMDPQPDFWYNGSWASQNTVDRAGRRVTAAGVVAWPPVTIRDLSGGAVVSVSSGAWGTEDPYELYWRPADDGDGDHCIHIAYCQPTLGAGESVTWHFQYVLTPPQQVAPMAAVEIPGQDGVFGTPFALSGKATPAPDDSVSSTTWSVVDGFAEIIPNDRLDATAYVRSASATVRLTVVTTGGTSTDSEIVLHVAPVPVGPSSVPAGERGVPYAIEVPEGVTLVGWEIANDATSRAMFDMEPPPGATTVQVAAGASSGTYAVNAILVYPGGVGATCSATTVVEPPEACIIEGPPGPLSPHTTASYAAPAGMSEYAWSISAGNGAIVGPAHGPMVEVATGPECDAPFTLALTGTYPGGQPAACALTVPVLDTTAPVFAELPAAATVECDAIPEVPPMAATDNCDRAVDIAYFETVVPSQYTLKWFAANPRTLEESQSPRYLKLAPASLARPTPGDSDSDSDGRAVDPLRNAVAFGSTPDAVEALTLVEGHKLALGQIVPFEAVIEMNGSRGPEDGRIEFTATWSTRTTSDQEFGYDKEHRVYCAFVDTADPGIVDAGGNARVESYGSMLVGSGTADEKIQGTFQVSGLEHGDRVVVEVWVVLMSTRPDPVDGALAAELVSARKVTTPPEPIPVVAQTVWVTNPSRIAALPAAEAQPPAAEPAPQPASKRVVVVLDRTWRAVDDCGNTAEHVQRIAVVNTKEPVFSKAQSTLLTVLYGHAPAATALPVDATVLSEAVPSAMILAANDTCGRVVPVAFSEVRPDGDWTDRYLLTRTWAATDAQGNTAQHVQTLTVMDNTAPRMVGPGDLLLACSDGVPAPCPDRAAFLAAGGTVSDNCDPDPKVIHMGDAIQGDCPRIVVRTYRAVDAAGNEATCTQTIRIAPLILATEWAADGLSLMLWGDPGARVVVEKTPDPARGSWTDIGESVLDAGGHGSLSLGSTRAEARGFYRARQR